MEKPWGQICHCHIQLIQRTRQRPGRYDLIRYLKSFTISKIHFKLCKNKDVTKYKTVDHFRRWDFAKFFCRKSQTSSKFGLIVEFGNSFTQLVHDIEKWTITWASNRHQSSTYASYNINICKRISLRSALIEYVWYEDYYFYKHNNYARLHVVSCSRYRKHKDRSRDPCKLPKAWAPKWGRIWKFP